MNWDGGKLANQRQTFTNIVKQRTNGRTNQLTNLRSSDRATIGPNKQPPRTPTSEHTSEQTNGPTNEPRNSLTQPLTDSTPNSHQSSTYSLGVYTNYSTTPPSCDLNHARAEYRAKEQTGPPTDKRTNERNPKHAPGRPPNQ